MKRKVEGSHIGELINAVQKMHNDLTLYWFITTLVLSGGLLIYGITRLFNG